MSDVSVPAGFSKSDTCTSAAVTAGSTCAISISFTPSSSGVASGAVAVTSNAIGFSLSVAVSGTGIDFSVSAPTNNTGTLTESSSASYAFSVSGSPGFTDDITFRCSDLPENTICAFSPTQVSPGAGLVPVTLTVGRVSNAASVEFAGAVFQAGLAFNSILFILLPASLGFRARKSSRFTLVFLVLFGFGLLSSCGGNQTTKRAPPAVGSYTFMVIPSVSGHDLTDKTITLTLKVE